MGLSDLSMADQLYNYMVGGRKRPLVSKHFLIKILSVGPVR